MARDYAEFNANARNDFVKALAGVGIRAEAGSNDSLSLDYRQSEYLEPDKVKQPFHRHSLMAMHSSGYYSGHKLVGYALHVDGQRYGKRALRFPLRKDGTFDVARLKQALDQHAEAMKAMAEWRAQSKAKMDTLQPAVDKVLAAKPERFYSHQVQVTNTGDAKLPVRVKMDVYLTEGQALKVMEALK